MGRVVAVCALGSPFQGGEVDAPELTATRSTVHAVSFSAAAAAAAGRAGPVQLRAAGHEEARLVRSEVVPELVVTLDNSDSPIDTTLFSDSEMVG